MPPIRRFSVALLTAPLLLVPLSTAGQEISAPLVTVTLELVDRSSGQPLNDVVVLIPELAIHLVSDANGHAVLEEIAVGSFEMMLSRLGFEELRGRFTVDKSGALQIALDPIVVADEALPGSVRGRVIAPESGEAIRGAEVSIAGTSLRRMTDGGGYFDLPDVPAGWQTLEAAYLGRATVRDSVFVSRQQVVGVEVELPVNAIELEGITVSTYPRWLVRSGFLRRQKAMRAFRGRQWTREMIAERDPYSLGDVVKDLVGIRREGLNDYYGARRCKLSIYVNDFLMDEFFDLDMIEPRRVEAVEVYHGESTPFGYKGCGFILIWMTR